MLLNRHKELTGQNGAKSPGLSRFSLSRLLFQSPKNNVGTGSGPGSGSGRGGGGGTPSSWTLTSSPRSAGRQGLGTGNAPGQGLGPGSGPRSGPAPRPAQGQGLEQGAGQSQHNSFAYTSSIRRSWMVRNTPLLLPPLIYTLSSPVSFSLQPFPSPPPPPFFPFSGEDQGQRQQTHFPSLTLSITPSLLPHHPLPTPPPPLSSRRRPRAREANP